MAISYPLTLPSHTGIMSVMLRQVNAVSMQMSDFSFAQDVYRYSGQRWEATVNLPPMKKADARAWIGWLASLNGRYGTFLMGDPEAATPQGSFGGTPLVNGASQTGAELVIDGATPSQTDWAKAGDYIQIGTGTDAKLYMVLVDADSDGSGNVTLDIWPDLRSSPSDNTPVVTSSCVGKWRLNSANFSWDVNSANIYGISFSAIEAIG